MSTHPTTPHTTSTRHPLAARLTAWAERAVAAGHPILAVGVGRFSVGPVTVAPPGIGAINDVFDARRETERARLVWVHAIVPTDADLLALGEAITTLHIPTLSRRAARGARRRITPAVGGLGPVAQTITRDGRTVHVLDLPVGWLDAPITLVRRPTPPGATAGSTLATTTDVTAAQGEGWGVAS